MMRSRLVLFGALIFASASSSHAQESSEHARELASASRLIDALRLDEAERVLAELDAQATGLPRVTWERGMLAFHRGDYASAEALAKQAIDAAGARAPTYWSELLTLITSTSLLTRDYVRVQSDDGRYSIAFAEGKDRVLVPHALELLQRADAALAQVMGQRIPGPVRLEIYPSAEALSKVSTLTVEQIETSGTVALCKWNRLMITSPRALVRGYPWVDTISHELTHLYLSYVTKEQAPVWLQEGTAKLLERRWRDAAAPYVLEPQSRTLLERATRDGKLLTFDQLHPSIALLPSQDDAALAFAQVSTFMDEFVKTHGVERLRAAFEAVAQGEDARAALAKAAGTGFAQLEKAWRAKLPKAAPEVPAPRKLARRFRAGQDDATDESAEVTQSEARRFLRIGDMLWDKQRVKAAMLEYEKSHRADRDDPIVATRFARAALTAGQPTRALEAVETLAARYPDHAPMHAMRGAALAAVGRGVEAYPALIEALRINPFDPEPQCTLASLAEAGVYAQHARDACLRLGGRQNSK
jgi:Peptidase MA superfamily/Tetratricopeptide repeat